MKLVKLSDLSEEERQKVLEEQEARINRNKQASEQIRVEANNKFNDCVSKNGSYDTTKHTTTIGNLKKAYKNTSNYNNIKKSLDNYYKNNANSLWDKVKQIASTPAGKTNNYDNSINAIRNINTQTKSETIENEAKQEYDNLNNLSNIQSNVKSYQQKQEEALKSTLSYKQAKLQNPNATEEELLKIAKNSSSELQTNLIKDMASKNGTEREIELKNISISDSNPLFYDNDKYRELNNEVLQYKTAIEAQEQANKINEDLKNGKVGSSVGHILQALPTKAMEAVASPIYTTGSLLNLKTPTGTADQDLKDWKTISSKYDQTTSNINNGLVRDASNVSGTIGYMIPSILASAIAPETNLGRIAQGVSVGGQSYIENLNDDASNKFKSALTGLGKGTASYAIEGISGGNILGKGSLDDLAVKTIASKTSNVASQKLASMVYEVGGEVLEEELENQVDYLIDKIVNGEGISLNEWLTEQKETVKNTIASTLVLKLLGLGGSTYKDVQEYEYNADAKKWINEAEKIIKKENLGIDVDKLKVKNNQTEVNNVLNTLENKNNTSNLQSETTNNEQNIPTKQVTSIENKTANNGNTGQNIENNNKTLYNNFNESESGINEQYNGQFIKRNDETTRIYEKSESKQNREYSWEEYNEWEKSIKPIEINKLTESEIKSVEYAKTEYNKDVVLYDETENNNTYSGGASKENKNKITISKQSAEEFGLNRIIEHENLESDILHNENTRDILSDVIEMIQKDEKFDLQKDEFWKGQEGNIPTDYLIAKDIVCDRFSEIKQKTKLDYDNVLSNATKSTLDNALINYYYQVYGKELEITSSFNLPTKQDMQKNILPIKEETQINMPTTQGETINWNEIEKPEGKIRKHYRSIIESSNTTKQAKNIAKELMGTDTYVPETNKGQLLQADNRINSSTPEVELKSLMSKAVNGEKINSVDIAVGERLIQYYSKIGDKTNLQEAIQATAMAGTSAGQTVQALAMLNHQTPQGQATWIQRAVDKMNNELAKKKGGTITKDSDENIKVVNKQGKDITNKVELFDLTSDMLEKVVNSNNETEMYNNIDQVYEELGQQVSKSTIEKLDSWRYFSMLANPRTHIRNMVGNVAMGKMQRVKDKLAGGIEDVVSVFDKDMERTKTLKLTDKKTKEFAKNDFNNLEVQSRLELNENKYNPQSRLQNARRTFKLDIFEKTLGKLFDLNDNLLAAEDGLGLKSAYQKALSDYITANKIDVDKITDTQLSKARNYAVQQAKEATFHQANSIATAINQFPRKNKLTKGVTDAILPFVKTPLNVAKSGLEYNPTGLLKTITVDTVKLNKGDISVNKYIDNLSKGLTGTGIAVLGYALADAGLLKASGEDDDKKENYDESTGKQSYSIQIAGKTYSLDWLAPAGIPLFTGAEAYAIQNSSKNEKNSISSDDNKKSNQLIQSLENWANAMSKAISPMSEMSMISGLTSALSSYSDDKLSAIGTNAVKSYVNQYVPTLLGQVAKTTDDYERSTTSTKTGTLTKAIDQTKLQIMSKVPGLRQQLPIKSDIWGNEQKQSENLPVRIFNNFINPATVKNVETSKVDEELNDLYDKTGDSSILPTAINKTYTINGQTYRMTNEEYANYKKSYGQTAYKLIEELTNSKDYNSLSNEQKQKVIENIYSYAKEANKIDYAKNNNIEVEQSTLYTTLQDLKKNGGNQSSYLTYLGMAAGVEKSVQKNQILLDSSYTDETKSIIYKNTTGKEDNLYNILSNGNIDINEYLEYKIKDYNEEFSADKDSNGNSISGSSKKKIYNYVKYNISGEGNRLIILGSKYKLEDDERRTLANYINETVTNNSDKLKIFESLSKNFVVKDGKVYYK